MRELPKHMIKFERAYFTSGFAITEWDARRLVPSLRQRSDTCMAEDEYPNFQRR
jgi:hypothetical protein